MATREMTLENFAEVVRTGIVFVDWWAPWCAPCRAFGPIYEGVAAKHPEVTFAKVNTEEQIALAAAFRIQAIPTLMAFRDGVLLFRHAGLLPAAGLEELLERVAVVDMTEIRRELAQAEHAAENTMEPAATG